MEPKQALEILMQAAAQAPMNKQSHIQVEAAYKALCDALAPKPEAKVE